MTTSTFMPSICIPRILPGVTEQAVRDVFERVMHCKCVERVDIVSKHHNGPDNGGYQRAFIHFSHCPNNETADFVRQRIQSGLPVNVVYDEPWFWKCSASRIPKPFR